MPVILAMSRKRKDEQSVNSCNRGVFWSIVYSNREYLASHTSSEQKNADYEDNCCPADKE